MEEVSCRHISWQKMPFFLVKKELEKILKSIDAFHLSSDNERYFIEVPNPSHRQILVEGRLIFIAGRIMIIREWCSDIESQQDQLSSIPLWIILEIPRELWTLVGIGYCASLFGIPLGMDAFTVKMSKMKFARVCVEVSTDFQFPETILVDLESRIDEVRAEYKWRPEICSTCRKFGHNHRKCTQETNHSRGRGQVSTGRGQRWQPMPQPTQRMQDVAVQPETSDIQVSDPVEKNSDSGVQRDPVTYTGTNPKGPCTTFPIEKEAHSVTPIANRFCALENLSEEELEEGEIAAPKNNIVVTNMQNTGVLIEHVSTGTNSEMHLEGELQAINSFLNLCEEVLASTIQATGNPLELPKVQRFVDNDETRVDKGGTKFRKERFDPTKPETWTEAMREAGKKISLVLERMEIPEEITMKPKKVNLKVKLVKGQSGMPIRSSSRNK